MYLYKSGPVHWYYFGSMTEDEMRADERFSGLFSETCVLYNNAAGKVYSFEPLSAVAARSAVPMIGSDEQVFSDILSAFSGTYKAPGVEEAQATADEAKAIAEQTKTTADTAAASVDEYMDALLGLDATDETEATDAE